MGTAVRVVLYADDADTARAAARRAFDEIASLDAEMSTYKPDSAVSRLNAGEKTDVPPRLAEVLAAAEKFRALSDGAFNVRYAGPLDLGAIAKGYAADRALAICGIDRAYVDVGGDLALGDGPWRIAGPEFTLNVENCGLATSGVTERGLHIIDPKTGRPAAAATVTVIAPDGISADALATAIFVLGPDRGLALAESLGVHAWISGKSTSRFSDFIISTPPPRPEPP